MKAQVSSLVRLLPLLPLAVATLALAGPPAGAASLAYLAESAVDPVGLSVIGPLPLSVHVVHPSGARAYGRAASRVGVLDTLSNTVIAAVSGVLPVEMVIDPGGARLYVQGLEFSPRGGAAGTAVAVVLVIDTATNAVVARFDLGFPGFWPSPPVMHPAGTAVYFFRARDAVVIDTATTTVAATIPLPDIPQSVAPLIHPSGAFIYVALVGGQVATIDTP